MKVEELPDDLIYQVCSLVLNKKRTGNEIERWLHRKGYKTANRQSANQILRSAYDRGIIQLPVREDFELAARLSTKSGAQCRVSPVNDNDPRAFEILAELAANQVMDLIPQIQANAKNVEPGRNEIHIGLAAGGTSRALASQLARKLKEARGLPEIWLHTLTSAFFNDYPDSAPVVSLGLFRDIKPTPKYVVLHSVPVVSAQEEKALRKNPFIREAFEMAREIDIVVTSVSVANHSHSLFQLAIQKENPTLARARIDDLLKNKEWAGDILLQPFSSQGRPIDCDVHAVSVVGFNDLVRLANAPDKHVVCIAGLCTVCKEPKPEAIVALMRSPSARRPFSHLVTTRSTAQEICKEFGW